VIGLGMTLVFLPPSASRRSPVFTTGVHVIFAVATILFAVLTAIGTG
jgi:hypothetical protein